MGLRWRAWSLTHVSLSRSLLRESLLSVFLREAVATRGDRAGFHRWRPPGVENPRSTYVASGRWRIAGEFKRTTRVQLLLPQAFWQFLEPEMLLLPARYVCSQDHTLFARILTTNEYSLAPEHMTTHARTHSRSLCPSQVYSVGVCLYHMLDPGGSGDVVASVPGRDARGKFHDFSVFFFGKLRGDDTRMVGPRRVAGDWKLLGRNRTSPREVSRVYSLIAHHHARRLCITPTGVLRVFLAVTARLRHLKLEA